MAALTKVQPETAGGGGDGDGGGGEGEGGDGVYADPRVVTSESS